VGIALAVELFATRNAFFFLDDWDPLSRLEWSFDALFVPHVQQLSALPMLVLKTMYTALGIDSTLPYRLATIFLHLAVAVTVFLYGRTRVGPWLALAAATPLLIVGMGSFELFVFFEINYATAIACTVLAFLALARRTSRAAIAASALFVVGVLAASVVMPFVVGAAAACLIRSDRRRIWWVPLPAAVVFATWYYAYRGRQGFVLPPDLQQSFIERALGAPLFVARAFTGGVGALFGTGPVAAVTGTTPKVFDMTGPGSVGFLPGALIAVAVVCAIALRVVLKGVRDPAQFAGLCVAAVVYWAILAMERFFQTPIQSNYVWLGSVIVALLLIEAFAGVQLPPAAQAAAVLVGILAMGLNWAQLERVRPIFDGISSDTRIAVTAAEVAGEAAWAESGPLALIGPTDAQWREIAARYGTAGYSIAEAKALAEERRQALDGRLALMTLKVTAGASVPQGAPVVVRRVQGARLVGTAGCVRVVRTGPEASVEFLLPPGGAAVTAARGSGAVMFVRRFGDGFGNAPFGRVGGFPIPAGSSVTVQAKGPFQPPWVVRLATRGEDVVVCGRAHA
jgi:hypothetical protein